MVFKHNDLHHQGIITIPVFAVPAVKPRRYPFPCRFICSYILNINSGDPHALTLPPPVSGISLTNNALGRQTDRFYHHQGTMHEIIYL